MVLREISKTTDASVILPVFSQYARTFLRKSNEYAISTLYHRRTVFVSFYYIMNTIFPRLVPAVFTGFVFWLLGRKGMNSTKAILIIITLALALSAFGHFVLGMS